MYKAIDIAKHIITYCLDKDKPVNNLQLQKILYFLCIDFYKLNKRQLIKENFCEGQSGDIIPEVYNAFCEYVGMPICH